MATLALHAAASMFSIFSSSRFLSSPRPSAFNKFEISLSAPGFSPNFHSSSLPLLSNVSTRKFGFQLYSTVQEVAVEEKPEETQDEHRKKLFVLNLPWRFSVADIKNLFGECGTVNDVEVIKQKDGRNRGFAFVTMSSGEEARAVVDKFDSYELSGRIIRVEFAKRLNKPSRPRPEGAPVGETRHKIYVSNLAWKVRSSHLREFFSAGFTPVSARVVFDSPSGRSAGYGFVSFATREEAESAISSLDGKELLGRPLRLKFSQKNVDESGRKQEEADAAEEQPEES
ncbi:PREDICTED: 29 kDa ribonucleoprotein A, chloroplastic [Nelumbo nucifera]|uniref:29 kDa ribonucleoprotein A, chloroplastic n=2 Tax=Nelumbo nucifera TaxID=4432 RepID=A0A1U8B9V6_NELNU|nr:PREDICTED: 29 kDa ribonucleoprotein A, chloroplastic [Nelumbo nucifera]DAD47483.1 TPA_asm: hypothetical protein HUJ06_017420 [Nelumbo nucifera]